MRFAFPDAVDLVSSARLWGVDLFVEALRVEDDEEATPVPAARERYARWFAAGVGLAIRPVRLPGRPGSNAVSAAAAPTRGVGERENAMAPRQVDVVVRGDARLGLCVGQRPARALRAEGADVWAETSAPELLSPPTELRGVRMRLVVRSGPTERWTDGGSYRQLAQLVIGLVILLAVLGVEVRFSFGTRVAALSLLNGAVVLWRSHGRRARTS